MAVELHIDDGSPWYLSPDIWVVPGTDPYGPQGLPEVGQRTYAWARVHNRSDTPVANARVRFYWADPSTAITRTTAHPLGTGAVALQPGETKDVLCLAPWVPTGVNGGHQCLVAEVSAPADPLPPAADTTPFDPPGDRHVAQRNITVILDGSAKQISLPFMAGGPGARKGGRVIARRWPVRELDVEVLKGLGLGALMEADVELSFELYAGEVGGRGERIGGADDGESLKAKVKAERVRPLVLTVERPEPLPEGTGVLVVVEELGPEKQGRGGLGLLLVGPGEQRREVEGG